MRDQEGEGGAGAAAEISGGDGASGGAFDFFGKDAIRVVLGYFEDEVRKAVGEFVPRTVVHFSEVRGQRMVLETLSIRSPHPSPFSRLAASQSGPALPRMKCIGCVAISRGRGNNDCWDLFVFGLMDDAIDWGGLVRFSVGIWTLILG